MIKIYRTGALLPETANWDNTQFAIELQIAIDTGHKIIRDGNNDFYEIINENCVSNIKTFTFGQAVEYMKEDLSVMRKGWNGKNMYIYLNKGSYDFTLTVDETFLIEGIKTKLFENGDRGTVTRLPNLNMKAATGSTVTGWLASQSDILAEDWVLV